MWRRATATANQSADGSALDSRAAADRIIEQAVGDDPQARSGRASGSVDVDIDISGRGRHRLVLGYHLRGPTPPMLCLHEREVAEEHRRQGHGRALLDAFMAAGKAAGATKMFLSTARANEPARRLYESVGGGLAAQGPTLNYWFVLR